MAKEDSDERENWFTIGEAAEELHVSTRTLQRWVKEGTIKRYKVDGIYRFDPADLEKMGAVVANKSEQLSDKADLVQAAGDLLRQSHTHNEKLIHLLTEPLKNIQEAHKAQIESYQKRIEHLEKSHEEMIRIREEMLDRQHDRNVEMLSLDASNERKNQVIGIAKQHIPVVLSAIQAKSEKAQAAVKLVQSISPEMMAALKESGMLTAEQQALIDLLTNPAAETPKK